MSSRISKLAKAKAITPPPWLPTNMFFEGLTGSVSYGCNDPDNSDFDIVGFCIPPKGMLFPHVNGYINGFGHKPPSFEQYQQHHILFDGKEYDFTIYSLVKYFALCADANPNMVDSLFTPSHCVLHSTEVYERVRERRREFLHKGCWHRFRGYAYAQMRKLKASRAPTGKRKATVDRYGFDTKFAYHIVRLCLECEQILTTEDLVLNKDRELYIAIRNGEWSVERLDAWFEKMEPKLEQYKDESSLPDKPNWDALNLLLRECLESHYGSLGAALGHSKSQERLLADIEAVLERHRA